MNHHSTTTTVAGQPPANVVPFTSSATVGGNEMIEAAQEMHGVLYDVRTVGRWVLRCVPDADAVR